MRLIYQLIPLELDVVQGSNLPLRKEENKTFLYINFSCGIIIREDREKNKKSLTFSVFYLLVALLKLNNLNYDITHDPSPPLGALSN